VLIKIKSSSERGYFTNDSDAAAGNVKKLQFGSGRWETALYNDRLQVRQIGLGGTDSTQDLLKLLANTRLDNCKLEVPYAAGEPIAAKVL
jgi:hypothetical protein